MSWEHIINNLFYHVPSQFIYDQYGQPIEVRYMGNYTDPQTQLSYFVYITVNDARTPILVPQPLAPHQLAPPPPPYPDDYPADPIDSPRPQSPRPQRQPSPRSSRRIERRSARREAMNRFLQNQGQIMFHSPNNIFNPRLPPAPMVRPVSPVRQQAPDPNSRRSRRRASRPQRDERAARIASGWIYGGAKTRRRRH